MASTEIDFQPAKPKKNGLAGSWEGCKNFCYNPQNGTFCGRSCSSWARIGLFYCIYYSLLAAFCAMMAALFFTTLNDEEPKQQGMNSLLKGNPGMAFIPMPNVETTLIKFRQGENKTYEKYVNALNAFLAPYVDENEVKKREGTTQDCSGERDLESELPCKFDTTSLGEWCVKGKEFGYYEGQPCVLMKMNKVWGWEPELYNETDPDLPTTPYPLTFNETMPSIPVTCQGERAIDEIKLNGNDVTAFPAGGLQASVFPFKGQKGFLWSLVWFRFNNVQRNTDVRVWCRAWARNLENFHRRDRNGGLRFTLHILT